MAMKLVTVAVLMGTCLFLFVEARDRAVSCGACKAVVDELKYAIKHTDQRKTIDLGSQRLGSDGSVTGRRTVQYAGSEVHLLELLEKICDEMNNYALSEDPSTGAKSYIRFNSRAGESVTLNNVRIDSDTMQKLKEACTDFVAEFEDEIINMFTGKKKNIEYELCHQLAGYCGRKKRSEL